MKKINYLPVAIISNTKRGLKKKQEWKEKDWIFSHFLKNLHIHNWKTAHVSSWVLASFLWAFMLNVTFLAKSNENVTSH